MAIWHKSQLLLAAIRKIILNNKKFLTNLPNVGYSIVIGDFLCLRVCMYAEHFSETAHQKFCMKLGIEKLEKGFDCLFW